MRLALTLFWVAAFADWWTTTKALRHGGKEGNPIVRAVMRLPWDSEVELAGLKLAVFLAFLWMGAPSSVWFFFAGLQFLAATWNAYVLHRAGRLF